MTSIPDDTTLSSQGVKRHRRKLSKEPPKSKNHPRPRSSSTPSSSAAPGSRLFFRRNKQTSIDISRRSVDRGPSLHLGPPPRGNTDAYDEVKEDDTTEWSRQVVSGLSNVHVRTPEREELPHFVEGESPFVLASDRASAIPSAWARQQLAAYLSGSESLDANCVSENEPKDASHQTIMTKLEDIHQPTSRFPEEFVAVNEQDSDQVVQATSSSLTAAHGIIDDTYLLEKKAQTPGEELMIINTQSPAAIMIPTSEQKLTSLDTPRSIEGSGMNPGNSNNPNYYNREQDENAQNNFLPSEQHETPGKTTIVLKYSKDPTVEHEEKGVTSIAGSKTSSRQFNHNSNNDTSTHITMPPPDTKFEEMFLSDPSPLDKNTTVISNEMRPGRMDFSSAEDPAISRFGLHATNSQERPSEEQHETVPRSVPDSADVVPHKMEEEDIHQRDDGQFVGNENAIDGSTLQMEGGHNNYQSTQEDEQPKERAKRPEPHTMDTSTTIDVDRRIPGSIW